MSEGALCLYNQTGYCKFKDNCRKTHEIKHVQKTKIADKKIVPTEILQFAEISQKKDCAGLVKTVLTNLKLK